MGEKQLYYTSEKEWSYGDFSDENRAQNGIGIKKDRDGSFFCGSWENGLRTGIGALAEPDGGMVIGTWEDDAVKEVLCRIYKDGDCFSFFYGVIEKEKPKEGLLLRSDGNLYYGEFNEWQQNDFNGEGVRIWPNGKRIYAGRWKKGNTDIGGVMHREDGRIVGTLSNVKKGMEAKSWNNENDKLFFYGMTKDEEARNAKGLYVYSNGELYIGEMCAGEKTGKGIFRDQAGRFYFGNYEEGIIKGQGLGIKTIGEARIMIYLGGLKDTSFHGEGCSFSREQNVWIFNFLGNAKESRTDGKCLYSTGNNMLYLGNFKEGKKDGKEESISQDGTRAVMNWKMGVPDISIETITEPGPVRKKYGPEDSISSATINSIVSEDNSISEISFMGIRADETSDYQRFIQIEPGCDYELKIYYHNDANDEMSGNAVAEDVTMKVNYPKQIGPGQDAYISSIIESTNTSTPIVWDCIKISSAEELKIDYKIASAKIHNDDCTNGKVVPQSIFLPTGFRLGTDELNGKIEAGREGYITLLLHAGGEKRANSTSFRTFSGNKKQTAPEIQSIQSLNPEKKKKRSKIFVKALALTDENEYVKGITADIGENINVCIPFTNSASDKDIKLFVTLPDNVEYVKGSSKLKLSYKSEEKVKEPWIESGLVLKQFPADAEGELSFNIRFYPSSNSVGSDKVSVRLDTDDISMNAELEIVGKE